MVPAGYMAKRVAARPDWLHAERVSSIYSVSGCISENFTDYIGYWKHNGYWLFDSPGAILEIAQENKIDLSGGDTFAYLMQFVDGNRLDLTLCPLNRIDDVRKQSLSVLLLDKDGLIGPLPPANEKDYLPTPPNRESVRRLL
jgi:Streptomycin adenylyltransferase